MFEKWKEYNLNLTKETSAGNKIDYSGKWVFIRNIRGEKVKFHDPLSNIYITIKIENAIKSLNENIIIGWNV